MPKRVIDKIKDSKVKKPYLYTVFKEDSRFKNGKVLAYNLADAIHRIGVTHISPKAGWVKIVVSLEEFEG